MRLRTRLVVRLVGSFAALAALVSLASASVSTAAPSGTDVVVTIVNNNILVVVGHGFQANGAVTVTVTAGAALPPLTATAEADGRFVANTFLPDGYAGTVSVVATQGALTANGSATASGTGAVMPASSPPMVEPAPEPEPAPMPVEPEPAPSPMPEPAAEDPAPSAPSSGGACVAPAGAKEQDVDPEDSPESPWPHKAGQEVVVYFETGQLSTKYANMVTTGAKTWSTSPCIDARAVAKCAADVNCVQIEGSTEVPSDGTDGEASGNDSGGVRSGASIILYTTVLDESSEQGALATVVHEMGHTLGLVHRLNPDDLMNATTSDDTNPVPDKVDFANLLAIYGQ